MKKTILTFLFSLAILSSYAQDIPEHISYTRIYDYLDELANDGVIELNSVTKPYARTYITEKLLQAQSHKNQLNKRQQEELKFFLNDFALEQNKLPDTQLNFSKNDNLTAALVQPAFNYKDSIFRARITPILGLEVTKNGNGSIIKRWYGADFQTMIGKHLSVYGSLRDISVDGALLSRPAYLNDYPGYEYKEATGGGDYSDSRGGVKYSWNWGSVGFVKDNIIWGDNYHGSNILSGRAPSFPMLTFHIKPTKWFDFQYFHGWLVSNVIDSTRYYVNNLGVKEYRMTNKFMAANMFTFTPIRSLDLSIGNSIIYAEETVQPAFFIPFAFYKSLDHTMTKGLGLENQNSQVFMNFSSRNIKHLHIFTSIFIDDLMWSRILGSNPERNPISVKVGAELSNFPIENLSLTGEFTQTNIITYKHFVPALTYASNGYNLGNYLGDNSREIYLALCYKPIRGLDLSLSFVNAEHGNEYNYININNIITPILSQPVIGSVTWSNNTVGLNARYEIFNNTYAILNIAYSDIKGYNLTTTPIAGEVRLTAQEYLNLFTPAYLQGKNTTITAGFSFGF